MPSNSNTDQRHRRPPRPLSITGEPPLGDLLDDPVTQAVMDSDRVDIEELSQLISNARDSLLSRER